MQNFHISAPTVGGTFRPTDIGVDTSIVPEALTDPDSVAEIRERFRREARAAGRPVGLATNATDLLRDDPERARALLGSVTLAMTLGHWYLVQPGLGRAPLRRARLRHQLHRPLAHPCIQHLFEAERHGGRAVADHCACRAPAPMLLQESRRRTPA